MTKRPTKKVLRFFLILSCGATFLSPHVSANWAQDLQQQLQQTPQWQQLNHETRAAEADSTAASQPLYNPELELSYDNKPDSAYQVSISQQIDLFDKRSVQAQLGSNDLALQRLQQQLSYNQLTAQALESLLEITRSQTLFELTSEQLQISQRLVSLAQQRFDAGDANQLDLDLVRLSLTEAVRAQAAAQADLQRLQAQRNNLIGSTSINLPPVLSLSDDTDTVPDFEQLGQQALETKIAALNAQNRQLSVQEAAAAAKADPTLSLGMGEDGPDNVVALTLSIPLNIRNSYSAEIRAAEARSQAADQAFLLTKTQVYNELQRSWSTYERQKSLQALLHKPKDLSMKQLNKKLEKLWQLGELNTTAYLQNLQQLNTALEADINLQTQTNLSLIDWLTSSNQLQTWLAQQ